MILVGYLGRHGGFSPSGSFIFLRISFLDRSKARKLGNLRKKVVHLLRSTRRGGGETWIGRRHQRRPRTDWSALPHALRFADLPASPIGPLVVWSTSSSIGPLRLSLVRVADWSTSSPIDPRCRLVHFFADQSDFLIAAF